MGPQNCVIPVRGVMGLPPFPWQAKCRWGWASGRARGCVLPRGEVAATCNGGEGVGWHFATGVEGTYACHGGGGPRPSRDATDLGPSPRYGIIKSGGREMEKLTCRDIGACHLAGGNKNRWTALETATAVTAVWIEPDIDLKSALASYLQ